MKRIAILVVFLAIAAVGSYFLFGKRVPVSDLAARFEGGHPPAGAPGGVPYAAARRGAPSGGRRGFRGRRGPVTVAVMTAVAASRDVPILQRAVGWVEPVATVNIRPRIDGMITQVAVKDGQMVKAGDLLFKLDDRSILTAIAKDRAQIARDTAMAAQAVSDAKRAENLYRRQAGAKMMAEQSASTVKEDAAIVQADHATLQADQIQLGYTIIRAPISGRLGVVNTAIGNYVRVADSSNTLVAIVQVAPVRVSFTVPERELDAFRAALARPGAAPVHVFVPGDRAPRATGRLDFVDNTVDSSTGTFTAKAEVANENEVLWPGQYVTVEVELGMRRGVTVVPLVAVQQGPEGAFVFRVMPNKTVEMRKVAVSETQGDTAVIGAGLAPGDHVVVEGQAALADGTPIRETVEGAARPTRVTRVGEANERRTTARRGRVQ